MLQPHIPHLQKTFQSKLTLQLLSNKAILQMSTLPQQLFTSTPATAALSTPQQSSHHQQLQPVMQMPQQQLHQMLPHQNISL